ncbi:MAG: AMP-dependent synthetase/ligase [Candidatus Eisenbacteria bacterium]
MSPAGTLIGIFLDTCQTHGRPDLFMRKTPEGWESLSSERARGDVEHLALALRGLGVQRGDRVALLSENRYEWPVSDLATLALGALTVPIYPTLTAEQCRYVLADSGARVLIVSTPAQFDKVRTVRAQLPDLQAIVYLDPIPARGEHDHGLRYLLERGAEMARSEPGSLARMAAAVGPDDLATIIYTSGTTGEPKGAMLTHGNIASNVWAGLKVMHINNADRCLSFLPLCHIFERMAGLYAMLAAGVSIAYAQSLDTVAQDAMKVHPTVLMGVPRFYEKVFARVMENARHQPALRRAIFHWGLERGRRAARAHFARRPLGGLDALGARIGDRLVAAKVRERVGGRLRFCISGGAPLDPKVLEFFFAVGIPIREGYGLTETSPVICLNPPDREKPGAVGPPLPGIEVRIGDEGEILTRGPHVMRGYFHNEEATRVALRDGWFHTGDIGHLDDEGYLVITDRLKDLLVTAGGKKVAPQPIEAAIKTRKWVNEAVLLGDRKPYVVALLVPNFTLLETTAKTRGWSHTRINDLLARPEVVAIYQGEIDRVNATLAPFEQIKRFALLERELSQEGGELTPTLKVRRRIIEDKFRSTIEALYPGTGEPGA